MTAIVTQGNATDLHLPDECVDLVMTSPPYFGLRSYQDGGTHYPGQIGDEATPAEYLDALIAATAEWMRVLKPGGSIFVNLGDCYSSKTKGSGGTGKSGLMKDGRPESGRATADDVNGRAKYEPRKFDMGVRTKSLVGTPWRYAIRCIDELGLILRAEIVWAKPNGLPESVTDRVRRSHEQVFHFVKQPRYYSAVDEVREQSATIVTESGAVRYRKPGEVQEPRSRSYTAASKMNGDRKDSGMVGASGNPLGKLPGSVWTIPTAPLKMPASLGIDHFAAYPPELVCRIVLGWSPREVCTACGEGRRPVTEKETTIRAAGDTYAVGRQDRRVKEQGNRQTRPNLLSTRTITGSTCACPDTTAPATPGVVLDPFAGTGTTMLVASTLGRVGIGVDLSADYCRLAQWRVNDPAERARVMKVDKPPLQVSGQLGLFEGGAA